MKLERREQANNAARNALASFSETVILGDLCIWKLVESSGLLHQKPPFFKPL
jgi:hypothetical protein